MSEYKIKESGIDLPFIRKISIIREIDPVILIKILSYNIVTPRQLSVVVNRDVSTINNLVYDNRKNPSMGLDPIYPWPVDKDNKGPMFILLNDKCFKYIKSCLNIN